MNEVKARELRRKYVHTVLTRLKSTGEMKSSIVRARLNQLSFASQPALTTATPKPKAHAATCSHKWKPYKKMWKRCKRCHHFAPRKPNHSVAPRLLALLVKYPLPPWMHSNMHDVDNEGNLNFRRGPLLLSHNVRVWQATSIMRVTEQMEVPEIEIQMLLPTATRWQSITTCLEAKWYRVAPVLAELENYAALDLRDQLLRAVRKSAVVPGVNERKQLIKSLRRTYKDMVRYRESELGQAAHEKYRARDDRHHRKCTCFTCCTDPDVTTRYAYSWMSRTPGELEPEQIPYEPFWLLKNTPKKSRKRRARRQDA